MYQVTLASEEEFGNVPSFKILCNNLSSSIGISSSLKWQNSKFSLFGYEGFCFIFFSWEISTFVMSQFKLFISSWYNFGLSYISRNIKFHLYFSNLVKYRLSKYFDLLNFYSIWCNISGFLFDLITWVLFHSVNFAKDLLVLIILSNTQLISLICYTIFISISLILVVIWLSLSVYGFRVLLLLLFQGHWVYY